MTNNEIRARYEMLMHEIDQLKRQFVETTTYDTGHPVRHTIHGEFELCACGIKAPPCCKSDGKPIESD